MLCEKFNIAHIATGDLFREHVAANDDLGQTAKGYMDQGALVPERFTQVQWTRLPGGTATLEFTERVVRLVRDFRKRERGLL